MISELPKNYEPAAVEAETYKTWLDEKCFQADPQKPGEPYCIVIPPPNVTGALHLGHAINNTLQDILTRMHRMAGFNTLWVPGIDHAGIATQAVVEKQLKEKEGLDRHQVGREGLVERIWTWKQQYGDRILQQLKRLGSSCDWSRTHFTLDEQCAKAVRETFFKLFKDGLIYRGKRLVNWDIHLQTSISDDEIYHETVKTHLWHIRYPIVGSDRAMTVATTRPETMLGDTAVAVHSEDSRWNWAIGKFVELPLTGRKIPIIADDILVDPKFGSGVVKVTPAHDPNDYAVYQRHLGKADEIGILNILNPNGTLNENAGPYANMKRDAARKKVVEDLGELLQKEEPYETQVGHSDRSKTPVEPYLSDQWFVKMAPLAEPALEVVRNGTIKFFPERHAQQYLSWLGEKRDWPISRQLWWGHRIPVWEHRNLPAVDPDSKIHEFVNRLAGFQESERVAQFLRGNDPEFDGSLKTVNPEWKRRFICVRDESDTEVIQFLADFGFEQDPDVLDTWFSSALWPHSTLGWPSDTADLRKWYPTSVLLTGRDIITLWVARMVMAGLYNMKAIPFHHVAINPTILDGKGERMSKSKGNGVDPVDVIDTHGADALRFTLTSMATETQDVRMPVKKDAQGRNTSDKFDIGRNFCNKLWNAARFALSNLQSIPPQGLAASAALSLSLPDRWIISRFLSAVTEANAALSIYRFDQYAKTCYDFFWRDFCDWYVEAIKPTLKDPARAAQTSEVLAAILDGALRLLHPMIPFITEKIWWQLNEIRPQRGLPGLLDCPPSKRLVHAAWPKVNPLSDAQTIEQQFSRLQQLIIAIRNVRNQYKIDPKKTVDVFIAPEPAIADLIRSNTDLIGLLAVSNVRIGRPADADIAASARAVDADCEIYLANLIDPDAEKNRQARQQETLEQKAIGLRNRLSNEAYISRAPAHLVQQTRDELAAVEAELAKLLAPR